MSQDQRPGRTVEPMLFVHLRAASGADPEFGAAFGFYRNCLPTTDGGWATALLGEVPVLLTLGPGKAAERLLAECLLRAESLGVPTTLVIGDDSPRDWRDFAPSFTGWVITVDRGTLARIPARATVRGLGDGGGTIVSVPFGAPAWRPLEQVLAAARDEIPAELAQQYQVPGEEELLELVFSRAATLAAAGTLELRFEQVDSGPPTLLAGRVLKVALEVRPYVRPPRPPTLIVVCPAWRRLIPGGAEPWLERTGRGLFGPTGVRRLRIIAWRGRRREAFEVGSTVGGKAAAVRLRALGVPSEVVSDGVGDSAESP